MQRAKEMVLKIYPVILLISLVFLVINCAPPPPSPPPTPPRFSFEPPAIETRKLDITFGIVAPKFDAQALAVRVMLPEDHTRMINTVDHFTRSMASDFEKMVIARGFKTKGPFRSLEEMTYPDKKGSDLTLSPKIYITTSYSTTGNGSMFFRAPGGVLLLSGFMEIIILEPLSGEKMWIKKIDFEPTSAPYEFSYYVNDKRRRMVQIDTRPEALKAALERIYPNVMNTAWRYLHPDEVSHLKKESLELRQRKRY